MGDAMRKLAVNRTEIDGLLVIDLELHEDARGWFKENWQRAKMTALGLPEFNPVQNNMSYNAQLGATRGIHAEPWDKLVSVATGAVFGAWVDLREGSASYGRVVTRSFGPETAVFVPRGVGNAYQALGDGTVYSYLTNAHWSPAAKDSYAYVNLADPGLGIVWPIPLAEAEISAADRAHPMAGAARPTAGKQTLVLGDGQLGSELLKQLSGARGVPQTELDFTHPAEFAKIDWSNVATVFNAAAYTAVDRAETPEGRRDAWAVNVTGLARLVELCRRHSIQLVHISSDYVFDGQRRLHSETEPVCPLGVYGQTKAAGDQIVATLARHYILRTSWLVGSGENFVRTMTRLAHQGTSPEVVADQDGRPTFTQDLAATALHLVGAGAAPGIYNVSNSGAIVTWHDLARRVFELAGRSPDDVRPITTQAYLASRPASAPRPRHSAFDLTKLQATGL
ncbi:MAG: bifunctional dTDP-4-dehydrorhamnose 3,5-epimerase family protein/NAD(P)-dependent oxidoreductase [Bifidobacteriaceae bacterium]|jgi:dTDP-4-dehydrorhamnose 3,5-epimerase|nr:bifunctional dTDP-4-dehydrorhamnose 3,5-epimerase family protein/NAD(P)-dependent oxidoreductase [Bifidobacteriaceae bacterium]